MRRLILLIALTLPAASPAAPVRHVKVFFLAGEQLKSAPRIVPAGVAPAVAAIRGLVAGPTVRERNAGYRTALGRGTYLVRLTSAGGRATVSLHVPAGPASSTEAEAAQVTFTLKAQRFDAVTLFLNGHSVATPSSTEPTGPPPGPPHLEPDVRAPADTRLVQSILRTLHFLPNDAITGTWDYRTEQAVMAFQAWSGLQRDGIVGPKTFGALTQATLPPASVLTPGRHVEVYRDRGVAFLVQNGLVLRAIHVSTGRPGFETPAGMFQVFRKERFSWSVPYSVWLPYASYFHDGVALHAYTEIPSTRASHGCVRVSYPEAATVYAFARKGTTVVVF